MPHRLDKDHPAPPGMTQEQLEFFADQSEYVATKAARHAVKHYRNSALTGFVGLLLGIILAIYLASNDAGEARNAIVKSGQTVSITGCNRDYEDRVKFIELLLRGKQAVLLSYKQKQTNAAQYARGVSFYDGQLAEYTLIDCRAASEVLTDDPTEIRKTPDPYWTGNDDAPQVTVPKGIDYAPPMKPGG